MTKITDYKIVCTVQSWLLVIIFLLPVFSNFLQCTETRKFKDQRAGEKRVEKKDKEKEKQRKGKGRKKDEGEKKRGERRKKGGFESTILKAQIVTRFNKSDLATSFLKISPINPETSGGGVM